MVILIIGLTMLFNSYIIPTELILKLLHGIKSDIGGMLSWLKREPKREILLKTIKQMEGDPFSEENFRKLNDIQQQAEDINTVQVEKDIFQNIGCCFEGFCRHKCLCINYLVLLTFSLIISILIVMVLSVILLGSCGNIQEDICSPLQ
jgi:hypothetical protein